MCLAIPMRLENIEGSAGWAEYRGVRYQVRLDLIENVAEGDYVMVHAGFAIQKMDEKEATETLDLFRELDELYRDLP